MNEFLKWSALTIVSVPALWFVLYILSLIWKWGKNTISGCLMIPIYLLVMAIRYLFVIYASATLASLPMIPVIIFGKWLVENDVCSENLVWFIGVIIMLPCFYLFYKLLGWLFDWTEKLIEKL